MIPRKGQWGEYFPAAGEGSPMLACVVGHTDDLCNLAVWDEKARHFPVLGVPAEDEAYNGGCFFRSER